MDGITALFLSSQKYGFPAQVPANVQDPILDAVLDFNESRKCDEVWVDSALLDIYHLPLGSQETGLDW